MWHGKYFNNDEHPNGVWRRTVDPSSVRCEQNRISVWIFGGSTVYGTGVPDDATLPSYLSRRLNRDGRACVVVTNLGSESFVTTQELILLVQLLKRGGRPNIVIFYDGFNDAHLGMQTADPSETHYGIVQIKARAEGSVAGRFDFIHKLYAVRVIDAARQLFRHPAPLSNEATRSRATSVLDNYQANHEIAFALGQAYHFQFYGFWQPMLFYGNKPLDAFERRITQLDTGRSARFDARPVLAAYQEAARRAPQPEFVFLANLFDSASAPLYIDEAHLGPRGNELAADAIAKYIEDHPPIQPR
jgi:lysophospholipase L1-like esterase